MRVGITRIEYAGRLVALQGTAAGGAFGRDVAFGDRPAPLADGFRGQWYWRVLAGSGLFVLALLLACGMSYALAADVEPAAKRVVEQTNAFRKAQNLQPVKLNDKLQAAAGEFARFMAQSGKYSHTADGREPAQRAAAQGYDACIVAENIARVYRSTGYEAPALAREMVEGWKRSPPHRKAMLDPAITQTGVAIARSAQGRYYGVQMFGRAKSEAIRFSVRNTAGQSVSYSAGGRRLSLAPRVERTHTVCRRVQVRIEAGEQPFTERPKGGERYTVIEREGALVVIGGSGT